jgi:hypothetical protein
MSYDLIQTPKLLQFSLQQFLAFSSNHVLYCFSLQRTTLSLCLKFRHANITLPDPVDILSYYTFCISSKQIICSLESSGMQHHVVTLKLTDISEVHTASFILIIMALLMRGSMHL